MIIFLGSNKPLFMLLDLISLENGNRFLMRILSIAVNEIWNEK